MNWLDRLIQSAENAENERKAADLERAAKRRSAKAARTLRPGKKAKRAEQAFYLQIAADQLRDKKREEGK